MRGSRPTREARVGHKGRPRGAREPRLQAGGLRRVPADPRPRPPRGAGPLQLGLGSEYRGLRPSPLASPPAVC